MEEGCGCGDSEPASVDSTANDDVHRCHDHLCHLVEGDRVLLMLKVRGTKEEKDYFDVVVDGVLDALSVENLNINIIINIEVVRGWCI